jgi:hypothetical protein
LHRRVEMKQLTRPNAGIVSLKKWTRFRSRDYFAS